MKGCAKALGTRTIHQMPKYVIKALAKKLDKYNKLTQEMSKDFKCPECGGKSEGDSILATMTDSSDALFPIHFNTCLKCKSWIPDHIGFRWNKMTVAQAKEEWEEFKNGEYLEGMVYN